MRAIVAVGLTTISLVVTQAVASVADVMWCCVLVRERVIVGKAHWWFSFDVCLKCKRRVTKGRRHPEPGPASEWLG